MELLYKQQKIIIDYENQISELRKQNVLLEQKLEKTPVVVNQNEGWDDKKNIVTKEGLHILSPEKYDEELKMKSKIIHEQQEILNEYQDQVTKLKSENQSLKNEAEIVHSKIIADAQNQKEDNRTELEEMTRKVKYYQDDNLRLSNEVIKLSTKVENTKQQLKQFEDNKTKLMYQLQNLSNIISENNIIDTPFGAVDKKNENVVEADNKVSEKKDEISEKKVENVNFKIRKVDHEAMNLDVQEIFKK